MADIPDTVPSQLSVNGSCKESKILSVDFKVVRMSEDDGLASRPLGARPEATKTSARSSEEAMVELKFGVLCWIARGFE